MHENTSSRSLVLHARNNKYGWRRCANTHVPIAQTCPRSCPFLNNGCYAQRGQGVYQLMRRLERYARRVGATALDIAKAEAFQIFVAALDLWRRGIRMPLRLHYSGDASTPDCARVLAAACKFSPGPVFTYTHAWRTVPRAAWGHSISVLASCETLVEAQQALALGYAPELTYPAGALPQSGRAQIASNGIRVIPCPHVTNKTTTCMKCRLCFDSDGLANRGSVIALEGHNSGRKKVASVVAAKRRLPIVTFP